MGLITINGHDVIECRLRLPRTGAWWADLRVDSFDEITGPVTITIADGQLVFKGTVWRGAEYVDTAFVRVVAGADGLRTLARARGYNQSSLRIVWQDLLNTAGEKLSSTADAATLNKRLESWTTAALPVGAGLARALASASPTASWRALPDGTFWAGPETWPDSGLVADLDYQIIDEEPRQQLAELGVEAPLLLPGTTLGGRRVSRVEHVIGAEGVRSWAWFEDIETGTAPSLDRLKAALAAVVGGSLTPEALVFNSLHWARVIAQKGSTIDVDPENPTIAKFLPGMGRVTLTMPAPGAAMQMAAAGRVLIGWSGGDPAKPYALAPSAETALLQLVFNSPDLKLGDTAAQPFPNAAYRAANQAANQALIAAFSALTGVATGPLAALNPGFSAALAALTAFEAGAATYLTTKAKAT